MLLSLLHDETQKEEEEEEEQGNNKKSITETSVLLLSAILAVFVKLSSKKLEQKLKKFSFITFSFRSSFSLLG